jgi:hypothetical protein
MASLVELPHKYANCVSATGFRMAENDSKVRIGDSDEKLV